MTKESYNFGVDTEAKRLYTETSGMTAKRFTLKHFEDTDWAYDNGEHIYTKDMVELLNALHDENEQLKQENQALKQSDNLTELEEENQELREENQQLKYELFCRQFDNVETKPFNHKCRVDFQ